MIDFVRMRMLLKAVPEYWVRRDDIIQSAALKGVQYSDMPRAPGYSNTKMDNAMVRLEDVEAAYEEAINELRGMQDELRPYIRQL